VQEVKHGVAGRSRPHIFVLLISLVKLIC